MRLLEKDIHDKQDTLISLRRQLEDVKKLNLELHNKLQVNFATQAIYSQAGNYCLVQ